MRQFPERKASGDRRFRPMTRAIKCLARRIFEVKDASTRRVQSTAGRVEDQRVNDQFRRKRQRIEGRGPVSKTAHTRRPGH